MAPRPQQHTWQAWITAPQQNLLRWAIAFSILTHALLLSWSFTTSAPKPKPVPQLEVVIINTFDAEDPLAPTVIAQASLDGGGDDDAGLASNPAPRRGEFEEEIALQAMTQQNQSLQVQQTQLLTQLSGEWTLPQHPPESDAQTSEETLGQDPIDQQPVDLNARIAAILEDIERYNSRPRKYFDAPSAIANRYAQYIDAWRESVEQTGSEHYPSGDGERPTGNVQVTVTIDANGQVVDVVINRPASDPRLNQAVRRILQIAGPFAPFPAAFVEHIDQLVITRTWEFTPGQLSTHAP